MTNDFAKSSLLAVLSLGLVSCIETKTVTGGGAPANRMVTGAVQSVIAEGATRSVHVTTRASGSTPGPNDPTPPAEVAGPRIVVNNMTFTLPAGAGMTMDGRAVDATAVSAVNLGMVVTLDARVSGATGVVNHLHFRDEIEGVVTAPYGGTLASGTLEVMGQTVTVNGDTVVEREDNTPVGIGAIPVNALVEVSGFDNGNGQLTATRIELKSEAYADGQPVEIKGVIRGVDAARNRITLGNLQVDLAGATRDERLAKTLDAWVGTYAEVRATRAPDLTTRPITLAASEIVMAGDGRFSLRSQYGYRPNARIRVEGFVGVQTADQAITLNDQPVTLDPSVAGQVDWALLAANYDCQRTAMDGYLDGSGHMVVTDMGYEPHTRDGFNDTQESAGGGGGESGGDRDDDDDAEDDD